MKKRKGSLLQRMMAVLLSAVLVVSMASNDVSMTVLAQENTESLTSDGQQENAEENTADTVEGDEEQEEETEKKSVVETDSEEQEPEDEIKQEMPEPEEETNPEETEKITVDEAGQNVQALLERIAALPDVEEYLAAEPDADDWAEDDDAYEEAYTEWMAGLYDYAEEALAIQEAVEELSEEEQAEIPEETLAKLAAWAEAAQTAEESTQVMTAESSMVMAADGDTSGTCGDNLTWTLADGVLTISGSGAMTDYNGSSSLPTWDDKKTDITSVVINEGVTSIGDYAFYNYTGLISVTIPAGMTSIGEGAFRECKKLTDITIPASVKNIGDSAFYTCSKLTTVTMQGDPPNLGGNYVFADCAFMRFNNRGIHVPKGRAQDYKDAWKNLENYITDHTHSWASAWTTNETHHWHECTESDCPITDNADTGGYGEHAYDDDSDTTCNTCGYTRTLQDTQPPTGEIKIEGHSWTQFLKSITFKWFFGETKQVTITAQDTGSGVDKIYYYISNYELESEEKLEGLDWTERSSFSIDPDKQCVIYVKITDKAGNVTYLSTDGLVFDATPPVISGVTDGGTYNEPQTVTVTDAMFGVKSVTVNGTKVTLTGDQFTLGTADGPQTIVATDQAGNTTTVTVMVTTKPQTYAVKVIGGSGSGNYPAGDTVTITANPPESGKQFNRWLVGRGGVTLAESTSSTTTFTMPAEAVSVTATYKTNTGGGSGDSGSGDHSGGGGNSGGNSDHSGSNGNSGNGNNNNDIGGESDNNGGSGSSGGNGITDGSYSATNGNNITNTPAKVPTIVITTQPKNLEDAVLTEPEKQQKAAGADIRIELDVKVVTAEASAADRALVEEALRSSAAGYTLGQYLDISLYKVIGDSRTAIRETDGKITIRIDVPDALKNTDGSRVRTFAVIRVHDGRTEFLADLDTDNDTITIETDRFSTYAVIYKDTADGGNGGSIQLSAENGSRKGSGGAKDNEPKTGDATPLELSATLAMIAGFAYLLLYFADRERGMTEERKKELVSRIVGWAKRGGRIRKYLALAAIFVLLVYYHSIGKKTCTEWKAIYGE